MEDLANLSPAVAAARCPGTAETANRKHDKLRLKIKLTLTQSGVWEKASPAPALFVLELLLPENTWGNVCLWDFNPRPHLPAAFTTHAASPRGNMGCFWSLHQKAAFLRVHCSNLTGNHGRRPLASVLFQEKSVAYKCHRLYSSRRGSTIVEMLPSGFVKRSTSPRKDAGPFDRVETPFADQETWQVIPGCGIQVSQPTAARWKKACNVLTDSKEVQHLPWHHHLLQKIRGKQF